MTAHIPRIIGSNRRFFSPAADRIATGEESARPTPQPNQSHRRPRTPIGKRQPASQSQTRHRTSGISPIRQQGRLSLGAPQPRAKSNASAPSCWPGVSRRAGGLHAGERVQRGHFFSAGVRSQREADHPTARSGPAAQPKRLKGKNTAAALSWPRAANFEQMPRARTCRFRRGRGAAPRAGRRARPRLRGDLRGVREKRRVGGMGAGRGGRHGVRRPGAEEGDFGVRWAGGAHRACGRPMGAGIVGSTSRNASSRSADDVAGRF